MKRLKEQKQTKLTKKEPDLKRRVNRKEGKRIAVKKKKKLTLRTLIKRLPKPIKYLLGTISLIVAYFGLGIWTILKFIYKYLKIASIFTFKHILKPIFNYIKKNLISVIILTILVIITLIGRNFIIKIEQHLEQVDKQIDYNQSNLQNEINTLKTEVENKNNEIEEKDKKITELEKKAVTSRGGNSRTTNNTNTTNTVNTVTGTTAEYQAYAKDLCINTYGWTESDFDCLVKLWNRESNWNPNAHNSSSGAHGIPQSLPASKMASEGDDYYTNGKTQIRWGLKYIKNRYGTPTKAWQHSQNTGWY